MSDQLELVLAAVPASASEARAFLREHAKLDGMRHAEADLLVTELIGNVIEHSPETDDIVVGISQDRERGLTVSVSHPHPQPLDDSGTGVGFMLLERLTRSWGYDHDGGELTVWFTLRTPGTTTIGAEVEDGELFERMADDPPAVTGAKGSTKTISSRWPTWPCSRPSNDTTPRSGQFAPMRPPPSPVS
jgi:hypothetical protein